MNCCIQNTLYQLVDRSNLIGARRASIYLMLKLTIGFVLFVAIMLLSAAGTMQQTRHPSLPMPSYIPSGFNLRSVLWNPSDGFGGGYNERAMIYVKDGPDRVTNRNLPLQVIVSSDLQHEFAFTGKADSTHELIHMDDGTELRGKYFYGEWASMRDGTRYWDSEAVHSLVFDYANFHVGIRAARQKVSFEELLRIAGSFAH